jgi:hypothetical protein
MSFGFSIGDAIILAQLTKQAFDGWKSACGEYANVTGSLASLQTLLARVEAEAQAPNSIFTKSPEDLQGWAKVSGDCRSVVTELKEIVSKYKSLGTSRRRNWDRIRMSHTNLDTINRELVKKTTSISAYLSILGLSSQGRVENELLPELLRRIDSVAAQMKKGNSTIRSTMTMTTCDGDDKALWREFRCDLLRNGYHGRDVKSHSIALQTYLGQLQRNGRLDEEAPQLYPPP